MATAVSALMRKAERKQFVIHTGTASGRCILRGTREMTVPLALLRQVECIGRALPWAQSHPCFLAYTHTFPRVNWLWMHLLSPSCRLYFPKLVELMYLSFHMTFHDVTQTCLPRRSGLYVSLLWTWVGWCLKRKWCNEALGLSWKMIQPLSGPLWTSSHHAVREPGSHWKGCV